MRFFFFILFFFASFAIGADNEQLSSYTQIASYSVIGVGFLLGLAALGGALGMGNASQAAITGIARNPSVASKISTTMYVCLAIIEAQVIYALVITFVLLFSNPLLTAGLKKAAGV